MPLSLEEATRRYESHSQNIQDSILIMESFMGSHHSFSFDLPQVITNLDSIDTYVEEKNVLARIKVLEEYQRMLITERKRRSMKEFVKGKIESADFKLNLKKIRRSRRLEQIFKPNVLPAMATAGQMPPQAPSGQMPPQAPSGQMPPQAPSGQMPPQAPSGQMPPQVPSEQMPSPQPISEELMLEL